MDDPRIRPFLALGLSIWLFFSPSLTLAEGTSTGTGRVSEIAGERASPAVATVPDASIPDSITGLASAEGELHGLPRVHQALTDTGLPGDGASMPVRLTDELDQAREGTQEAPSASTFTPQDEEILLGVAAIESRLSSARQRLLEKNVKPNDRHDAKKTNPDGTLSSMQESGGDIAAIGYDAKGGTSYGLYQIASNTGTMELFLQYLAAKAPDIYQRLAAAGPDNTGGTSGGKPEAWRQIAAEQDKRFAALQHDFILESHYEPAARSIEKSCGLIVSEKPQAMREVLWSTSVHHGVRKATRIFVTAVDNLHSKGKAAQNFDRSMIEEIYRLRSDLLDKNGVRATAVRSRLQNEKEFAFAML